MKLLENMNILVVEDEELTRRNVMRMVRCFGATEIFSAGNGVSALKLLKEREIDLVLSDWNMPLLSGLRLLQTVRRDETLKHILFIMLTGANDREAVLEASREGVDDYLIKPIGVETLAEKIRNRLENGKALQMDTYHLDIGTFSQGQGDLDLAIGHYRKAIRHNPENHQAHLALGEACHQKGSLPDALAALKESIRLNSMNARAHFSKSLVHIGLRQRKEARQEFDIAIELDPQDLKRCTSAAQAFLEHGYIDEAASAFRIALTIDPHDVVLYNKMGIALRKNGRGPEAVEQYQKALRIKPEDPTLLFNLSKAYLSMGQTTEARQILEKTILQDDEFQEARELLDALG